MQKLSEICFCDLKKNSESEFVGIRCEKGKISGVIETSIVFPLGYFKNDDELKLLSDDYLRTCVFNLFSVLADSSLQNDVHPDSRITVQTDNLSESTFPMVSYINVIRNFLDFGYISEKERIYKKGVGGKVHWGRTIKTIKPVVEGDGDNLIYLDLVVRKVNYNEDCLITLVHKYCVHDALMRLGFLFGVEPTETPCLDFDYDLFCNVINSKKAKTFNDRDLHLLADLAQIVEYLAEHRTSDGTVASEFYFGVNKFAPIWEAMVNRIFGTVSYEEKHDKYNPHLKFVPSGDSKSDGVDYQEAVNGSAEYKRSTLRPDTIMILEGNGFPEYFVLDSKYYKFGITLNKSHLPGAESVCKQMAYAEYVEKKMNAGRIYNAFIMPYCADDHAMPFGMKNVGYIFGDWKNRVKPYHKISCVLLDMKSVMQRYVASKKVQKLLSNAVKQFI